MTHELRRSRAVKLKSRDRSHPKTTRLVTSSPLICALHPPHNSCLTTVLTPCMQCRQRANPVGKVRLQVQRLCALGLPRAARAFPSRPRRLPSLAYGEVHPVRARLSRKVRQLLLLFPRLPLHHQDHLAHGTQVPSQDPQGLPQACSRKPSYPHLALLRPAPCETAPRPQNPLRHYEQPLSAPPRYTRDVRSQGGPVYLPCH